MKRNELLTCEEEDYMEKLRDLDNMLNVYQELEENDFIFVRSFNYYTHDIYLKDGEINCYYFLFTMDNEKISKDEISETLHIAFSRLELACRYTNISRFNFINFHEYIYIEEKHPILTSHAWKTIEHYINDIKCFLYSHFLLFRRLSENYTTMITKDYFILIDTNRS